MTGNFRQQRCVSKRPRQLTEPILTSKIGEAFENVGEREQALASNKPVIFRRRMDNCFSCSVSHDKKVLQHVRVVGVGWDVKVVTRAFWTR